MPKFSIKICRATNLSPKGISGLADPYVKLKLGRQEKRKTKIMRQTLSPLFDEWFDYNQWRRHDLLVISVWNANSFSTNDFMGQLQFEYPDDPTGHYKACLSLRPDALNTKVTGTLELEIVNIDVKRAYEKQHGLGKYAKQGAQKLAKSPQADEGTKLMKRMRSGDSFTMYTSKGDQRQVNVYWTDYGGVMGELVWQTPGRDPSSASDRHRLPLHTLSDVFVGYPCPHSGKAGQPDCCISFKGKQNAMNLEAPNNDVLEAWLSGVKYILMSRGKKVVQNESNSNGTEKTTTKRGRRLTVTAQPGGGMGASSSSGSSRSESNRADTTPVKSTQFRGEETKELTMMLEGCDMMGYVNEDAPTKTPIFVFFSPKGGKFGSIYWCERGSRRESSKRVLLMHELTDIYVGKQQKIFQHPIASGVEDQRCFSIISKKSALHIEAESVQVMKDWMVGINHVLTSTGRKVVLENETGKKTTTPSGRRFSRHFSVAVRSKSTHPGVLAMAKGATFTRFRTKKSRPDRSVKTTVFVFHSRLVDASGVHPGKASSGALFWYEKKDTSTDQERRAKDRSCIPIHSITDIFSGKQKEIFQTKCANLARDECVISIFGQLINKKTKQENFELHLEAESPEAAREWMEGISHLLTKSGRVVEEQETSPAASSSGPRGKRMSVARPKQPVSSDPFDLLGMDHAPVPTNEDLNDYFPESRPDNPFEAAWDPFPGQQQQQQPAANNGTPADPFAGSGFADAATGLVPQQNAFASDPFPGASAQASATPMSPGSTVTATPAPTPATKDGNFAFDPASAEPILDDPFAHIDNEARADVGMDSAPPALLRQGSGGPPTMPPPQPVQAASPVVYSSPPSAGAVDDLSRYLASVGLDSLAPMFAAEEVDLESLRMFSADDLKGMGIKAGPRIKIAKTLPSWQG